MKRSWGDTRYLFRYSTHITWYCVPNTVLSLKNNCTQNYLLYTGPSLIISNVAPFRLPYDGLIWCSLLSLFINEVPRGYVSINSVHLRGTVYLPPLPGLHWNSEQGRHREYTLQPTTALLSYSRIWSIKYENVGSLCGAGDEFLSDCVNFVK